MMVNPTFAGHDAISKVVIAGYEVPLSISPSAMGPAPPFDFPSTPPSAGARQQQTNDYLSPTPLTRPRASVDETPESYQIPDEPPRDGKAGAMAQHEYADVSAVARPPRNTRNPSSGGPTLLPDPKLHAIPNSGTGPGATKAAVAAHADQTYAVFRDQQTYALFSDPAIKMPAVVTSTDRPVAPVALVNPVSSSAQYEYDLPAAAYMDYAEVAPIDAGDVGENDPSAAMPGSQRQHAEPARVGAPSGDPSVHAAAEPVGTAMVFLADAGCLQPHMVYSTANDAIPAGPSAVDDGVRRYDMPQTEDTATACNTPSIADALASAGDAYEMPMDDAAGSAHQAYDADHGLVYTGAAPVPLRETYAVPAPVCDTPVGMYAVPAAKADRLSATTASSLLVRRAEVPTANTTV